MKISEIENIKPKTPEQLRVGALKQHKDQASDALKAERKKQKQQKAQEKIRQAQTVLASIPR